MKKITSYWFWDDFVPYQKLLRIMKLTFILILTGLVTYASNTYSQATRLSLKMEQVTIQQVFDEIENQSEFKIAFNSNKLDVNRKVNVDVNKQTVDKILDEVLENQGLNYEIVDRYIVITDKTVETGSPAKAKQKSVSGKVTNETGESLPGVAVMVKETVSGAVTDEEGNYSLTIPDGGEILVFSFVGMLTQEIVIGTQTTIDVVLVEDIIGIEEVVAVGYATQRKVNLTGAVAVVDAEKIADRPIVQTSTALQGLAPGVVVTQNLGTPGSDAATIRIRGRGSISSNQNPLVIVDGIQVGSINDVNPEDIESISVLKDAASAAIYGSRAANGVILITTKRATKGTFSVSGDFSAGLQSPTMLPEFVGLRNQFLLEDVNRYNRGLDLEWNPEYINNYVNEVETNGTSDAYQNNNWYDLAVKSNAPLHREQVVFSGGSEMVQARVSLVNMDQNGLIDNASFNRKSIRSNIGVTPVNWLKFNADFYLMRTKQERPPKDIGTIFHMVNELEPYRQARVGDGLYGWAWKGDNPIGFTESGGLNTNEGEYTLINLNAIITPVKGLKVELGYSNTVDNNYHTNFTETFDFYAELTSNDEPLTFDGTTPDKNSLRKETQRRNQNYYKAIATYTNTFGEHELTAMLGGDALDFEYGNHWGSRTEFPFGINYPQLGLGNTEGMNNGSSGYEWALASGFGRINYVFKNRYLAEVSFRYDGSSRFAQDYRWGFFPAVSLGWRLSEEGFLNDVEWLSNLKLRASWGQLGNQNIGNYPYQSLTDINQSVILSEIRQQGAAITEWAVNDITWEKSEQFDIGLDFGFFNNRLNGSFDYYHKNNTDILLKLQIPQVTGLEANYQNAASMENKGWEIILNWNDKVGDFGYYITGQLDDNQNKVTDLLGTGPYISGDRIREEGTEFDAYYGYVAEGGFMSAADLEDPNVPKWDSETIQEGSLKLKDISGPDGVPDGKIDINDRTVLGSSMPRYNYSILFGGDWKGLALDVILQGVGKRQGYMRRTGENFGNYLYDWEADFYIGENHPVLTEYGYDAAGLKANTTAEYPAYGVDNGGFSDFWLKSRAYLRIKNVTLSYTLPKRVSNQLKLKNVRFYISADNLYTFHNFIQGFDPENADGRGYFQYPNISKFMGGINIAF